VASLSQGCTAAAQCGLFTYKSVPVIFEPPCTYLSPADTLDKQWRNYSVQMLGFRFVMKNTFRALSFNFTSWLR